MLANPTILEDSTTQKQQTPPEAGLHTGRGRGNHLISQLEFPLRSGLAYIKSTFVQ